jgi:arsenical-resistance protein 2
MFNSLTSRSIHRVMSSAPAAKWFDALPTPKSVPRQLTVKELHQLLRDPERSAGVLVVDVRRADIEVDHRIPLLIKCWLIFQPPMNMMLPRAINLPAQTFFQTLPTLLPILQRQVSVHLAPLFLSPQLRA